MFKNVLSFKGRIRRTEFGLTYIFYFVSLNLLDLIIGPESNSELAAYLYIILVLFLIYVLIAQSAKRCHDRGNSGWYQIIPFYGLWLLFADSDHGPNQYGPNPKGIGNDQEIDQIGKTEED
ncbi:DUF805 domain-containing protein [Pontimicrobium sp. IMCC45349]|uniref:DUF805 domain-containing protein n=1 Tax=Pontimicrobium sp. IMCC45349 TaxID=3391574 RepID=UPI0039A10A64